MLGRTPDIRRASPTTKPIHQGGGINKKRIIIVNLSFQHIETS